MAMKAAGKASSVTKAQMRSTHARGRSTSAGIHAGMRLVGSDARSNRTGALTGGRMTAKCRTTVESSGNKTRRGASALAEARGRGSVCTGLEAKCSVAKPIFLAARVTRTPMTSYHTVGASARKVLQGVGRQLQVFCKQSKSILKRQRQVRQWNIYKLIIRVEIKIQSILIQQDLNRILISWNKHLKSFFCIMLHEMVKHLR